MTNLNDIIKQKAQELYPDFIAGIENSAVEPFRKGVERATTDPSILQAIFNKFHDWCQEMGIYKDVYGEYHHVPHGSAVLFARSERELTEKYIQHLQTNKQKEDDNG